MYRRATLSATLLIALIHSACPASSSESDDAGVVILDEDTSSPDDTGSASPDTGPSTNNADCVDGDFYVDSDGDGRGAGDLTTACAIPGQDPEGYARLAGDCNDSDPLQFQGSEGVCNDFVDDDCDGVDEVCPESRPDQVAVPNWDCNGDAPESVFAWARFADGGGFLKDGACFVYFEGAKDVFYSTRVGVEGAEDCSNPNGCICPGGGSTGYDQRLYAFNLSGTPGACDEIAHTNSQGMDQAASNSCRKYLYQLHQFDIAYSHVATTTEALERRLTAFPTVEVACVADLTFSFPFSSLLTAEVQLNSGFVKK